jgi:hypothetical protein
LQVRVSVEPRVRPPWKETLALAKEKMALLEPFSAGQEAEK